MNALTSFQQAAKVTNSSDLAYLTRHAERFAYSLIRKYRTLGEEYCGFTRMDPRTQKLTIHLARLIAEEEMEIEAGINLNVGLVYSSNGRRLAISGEITQPGRHHSILPVEKVLGADPTLDTRLFMVDMVKNGFIASEDAAKFMSDFDDLDEEDRLTRRPGKWSRSERFARMKFKHLRRAFVEAKGAYYKTVDFSLNANTRTFRWAFHAKEMFDGRHIVFEGKYHLKNWDADACRPEAMTLDITKMSVTRDIELEEGLYSFDLAIGDRHEDTIDQMMFMLEKSGALFVTEHAEKAALRERRERPTRQERAVTHRTGRRLARMAARQHRVRMS